MDDDVELPPPRRTKRFTLTAYSASPQITDEPWFADALKGDRVIMSTHMRPWIDEIKILYEFEEDNQMVFSIYADTRTNGIKDKIFCGLLKLIPSPRKGLCLVPDRLLTKLGVQSGTRASVTSRKITAATELIFTSPRQIILTRGPALAESLGEALKQLTTLKLKDQVGFLFDGTYTLVTMIFKSPAREKVVRIGRGQSDPQLLVGYINPDRFKELVPELQHLVPELGEPVPEPQEAVEPENP